MKWFAFILNSWHLFCLFLDYMVFGYTSALALRLEFEIKTPVLNVFQNIHNPYRPPCTDIHVNQLIS